MKMIAECATHSRFINSTNQRRNMKTCKTSFVIYLLLPALFLGCSSNNPEVGRAATLAQPGADSQGRESGGVVRQTPAQPARAALSESKVIATRQGPNGLEFDLTRIGFTGDLMTIEFLVRNPTKERIIFATFPIEKVSFIDDATSRRYGVVKDQSDNYMASPSSGAYIERQKIDGGGYSLMWFKFPVPPPSTQTISITIPTVNPFDGISLQR
jgi:hypothetical protein